MVASRDVGFLYRRGCPHCTLRYQNVSRCKIERNYRWYLLHRKAITIYPSQRPINANRIIFNKPCRAERFETVKANITKYASAIKHQTGFLEQLWLLQVELKQKVHFLYARDSTDVRDTIFALINGGTTPMRNSGGVERRGLILYGTRISWT